MLRLGVPGDVDVARDDERARGWAGAGADHHSPDYIGVASIQPHCRWDGPGERGRILHKVSGGAGRPRGVFVLLLFFVSLALDVVVTGLLKLTGHLQKTPAAAAGPHSPLPLTPFRLPSRFHWASANTSLCPSFPHSLSLPLPLSLPLRLPFVPSSSIPPSLPPSVRLRPPVPTAVALSVPSFICPPTDSSSIQEDMSASCCWASPPWPPTPAKPPASTSAPPRIRRAARPRSGCHCGYRAGGAAAAARAQQPRGEPQAPQRCAAQCPGAVCRPSGRAGAGRARLCDDWTCRKSCDLGPWLPSAMQLALCWPRTRETSLAGKPAPGLPSARHSVTP